MITINRDDEDATEDKRYTIPAVPQLYSVAESIAAATNGQY